MIEILTTNDAVRLSFLRSVLKDAGIDSVVLDGGVSAVLSSAFPARLMVDEGDETQANRIIAEAERAVGEG